MPTTKPSHDASRPSVASVPLSQRHRRTARAFNIGIVGAAAGIALVGLIPLPRSDGFVPAVQAIIATAHFITAVLLFAQYAAERSRALLLLAGGYLFTTLIVVAHTLTFPGAFTATGLLGAGQQTAAWLYLPWHVGVPAAALGYVLLRSQPTATAGSHTASAAVIARTVLVVVAAASVLTWAAIVAQDSLPTLVIDGGTFSSTATGLTVFPLVLSVLATGVLWPRRRSHLDEWLLVALVASVAETALVVFLGASRYTFPFYATRPLAVVTSCAVLVALLSEMMRLYVRLSTAVNALERERANKLMNLDVVVRSIAHEVKQPLMVITTCNAVIKNLLGKSKVDVDEVRVNLDDVTSASLRIGESVDSLRGLFKNPQEAEHLIDVNELARASLKTFRAELSDHGIAVSTELVGELPPVVGHEGQLRAVVVNIVQNAIDELAPLTGRARTLRIRTSAMQNSVSIRIEDSGGGIAPERLPTLFGAFTSTKAGGMGLGLSLCQMIVERHNGKLSVSSELGRGTTFEVTLPAERADAGDAPRIPAGSINAEA